MHGKQRRHIISRWRHRIIDLEAIGNARKNLIGYDNVMRLTQLPLAEEDLVSRYKVDERADHVCVPFTFGVSEEKRRQLVSNEAYRFTTSMIDEGFRRMPGDPMLAYAVCHFTRNDPDAPFVRFNIGP